MRFPLGERVYMRCIFPQSQLYSSFGASFDMGVSISMILSKYELASGGGLVRCVLCGD